MLFALIYIEVFIVEFAPFKFHHAGLSVKRCIEVQVTGWLLLVLCSVDWMHVSGGAIE